MSMPTLSLQRLPHGADLPLPHYATPGAAGMDLPAAIDSEIALNPGERALIPTGFAMAVPDGFEAQIRPRSGLAARNGITVLNTPGTIDSDYRGEVQVILINLGQEPFIITRGMRIAQMIIAPVTIVSISEQKELPDTQRGNAGFGSTGLVSSGIAPAIDTGGLPPANSTGER